MEKWNPNDGGEKQTLPYYPNCKGVYILTDENDSVLYVGRSKQLCRRISHLTALQEDLTNSQGTSHIKAGLIREFQEKGNKISVTTIETENYIELEKILIEKYKPLWNKA